MSKKILIADDHSIIRLGMSLILENNFEEIEIDFAKSYTEVKDKITTNSYGYIFLDINYAGKYAEKNDNRN